MLLLEKHQLYSIALAIGIMGFGWLVIYTRLYNVDAKYFLFSVFGSASKKDLFENKQQTAFFLLGRASRNILSLVLMLVIMSLPFIRMSELFDDSLELIIFFIVFVANAFGLRLFWQRAERRMRQHVTALLRNEPDLLDQLYAEKETQKGIERIRAIFSN